MTYLRLLRVPCTARSNQSILKEFNPEYSLQGLMLQPQQPPSSGFVSITVAIAPRVFVFKYLFGCAGSCCGVQNLSLVGACGI